MSNKLKKDQLIAELATVGNLLKQMPKNDILGKIGFESRFNELKEALSRLEKTSENLANIALFFGGKPVIGSKAIDAEFASDILGIYQELLTKITTSENNVLGLRGPVKDKKSAKLHITSVVHGSFGFQLEELDAANYSLFPSPLKIASDKLTEIMLSFANGTEEDYSNTVDVLNIRVFSSLRSFFKSLHNNEAEFRIVEGKYDRSLDRNAIERAFERIESTAIEEEESEIEGELLGIIPIARRFEFKKHPSAEIITGKIDMFFGQEYLERISKEHLAGRKWRAKIQTKTIRKLGRKSEILILNKLESIS